MGTEYYISRNGKERGPLSASQLRQLAANGKLKPTDFLRKDGTDKWVPCSSVKGLFPETPAPITDSPQELTSLSLPPPLPKHTSASSTIDDFARGSIGGLKAAAKLTARKAERTKLLQVDLPAAYLALGKAVFSGGTLREHFPDEHSAIEAINQGMLVASQRASATFAAADGFVEKAKATASRAAGAAEHKLLQTRLNSQLRDLGRKSFDKLGSEAGPTELVETIANLRASADTLQSEAAELSQSAKSSTSSVFALTEPWRRNAFVVAASLLFCFPAGLFFIWRHPQWSIRRKVAWTAPFLPLFAIAVLVREHVASDRYDASPSTGQQNHDEAVSTAASVTNADASTASNTSVPASLTRLTLSHSLPVPRLRSQRSTTWKNSTLSFGNIEGYMFVDVYDESSEQVLHLWNTASDTEVVARPHDGRGFTRPATFSSSGRYLACLDEKVLRIWKIDGDAGIPVRSVRMPSTSGNTVWQNIHWHDDEVVFVDSIIPEDNHFVVAEFHVADNVPADGLLFDVPFRNDLPTDNAITFATSGSGYPLCFIPSTRQLAYFVPAHGSQRVIERPVLEPGSQGFDPTFKTTAIENSQHPARIDLLAPNATQTTTAYQYSSPVTRHESIPAYVFANDQRLAVATSNNNIVHIALFDTRTWKPLSDLALPASFSKVTAMHSSVDGHYLAMGGMQNEGATDLGQIRSKVIVWDTVGQKLIYDADLTGTLQGISFSKDGKSLFAATMLTNEWNEEFHRNEAEWHVVRIDIPAGTVSFDWHGDSILRPAIELSKSDIEFSALGQFISCNGNSWSLDRLEELNRIREEGLRLYENGEWLAARTHFATILFDPTTAEMWWLNKDVLPQYWGRCFDCYIAENKRGDAESLLRYCDDREIKVSPQSKSGESVLAEIRQRQADEQLKREQRKREQEAAELAQFRAQNRQARINSRSLTKSEFVQELRNTMARGSIGTIPTYAIFEGYSFQDRIGDPDRDRPLSDSRRYYVYVCRDGSVGVTVFVVGSRVILSELDVH